MRLVWKVSWYILPLPLQVELSLGCIAIGEMLLGRFPIRTGGIECAFFRKFAPQFSCFEIRRGCSFLNIHIGNSTSNKYNPISLAIIAYNSHLRTKMWVIRASCRDWTSKLVYDPTYHKQIALFGWERSKPSGRGLCKIILQDEVDFHL